MAVQIWLGSAAPVQQIRTYTVGGTIAAGDTFNITVGAKVFTYTAPSSPTTDAVAAGIAALVQGISTAYNPEFSGLSISYSSGSSFTIAGQLGVPFDIQGAIGSSAAGTFGYTDTVPASGPNFANVAANWSTGSVPASGDTIYLTNSSVSLLYGLDMHTVTGVTLNVDPTFTGYVGLPRNRGQAGTVQVAEYLPTYWEIGATVANLAPGGGRCKLDTGSGGTALNITGSAASAEPGVPPILWLGTGGNTITISKGSFAAAFFAGEAAAIGTLNVGWTRNQGGDATVQIGAGCTVTTITQTGGVVSVNGDVTTFGQNGKSTAVFNAGNQGTLTSYSGGTFNFGNIASYASLTVGDSSTANFQPGASAVTGTNTTLIGKFTYQDPGQRVTWTNPAAINNPDKAAVLNLGAVYELQRS